MNERDSVRLRHMLDEAHKAQQFVQERSRDDLDRDELLSYAVRYALQIVGEAASQITTETRTQNPEVHWKDIIGMRQWLVHGYERVQNEIIWNTLTKDMVVLIAQLETILSPASPDTTED
jgi:uncharacterized protein with HEPN domain